MGQESLGCGFHVIKMVSAAGWNVGGRLEVGGATGREQHSVTWRVHTVIYLTR